MPLEPEGSLPKTYTRAGVYPGSSYNPYGSNFIRYGFRLYNYPWYTGGYRGPMLPLAGRGVIGYRRFPGAARGRGMSRGRRGF